MVKKKEKFQQKKENSLVHEKKEDKPYHDCKKIPWVLGILGAFYAVLLAVMSNFLGMGTPILHIMKTVYLGYDATLLGMIIGALWGFIDMYILGLLFEWLYHKF